MLKWQFSLAGRRCQVKRRTQQQQKKGRAQIERKTLSILGQKFFYFSKTFFRPLLAAIGCECPEASRIFLSDSLNMNRRSFVLAREKKRAEVSGRGRDSSRTMNSFSII